MGIISSYTEITPTENMEGGGRGSEGESRAAGVIGRRGEGGGEERDTSFPTIH